MDQETQQMLALLIEAYARDKDGGLNPNGTQDIMQMLADPLQSALMGGTIDPMALMPTVETEELDITVPRRSRIDAYLNGSAGIEQTLAIGISQGRQPEEVIAEIMEAQDEGGLFDDDRDGRDRRAEVERLTRLGGTLFDEQLKYDQAIDELPRDEHGNVTRSRQKVIPSALAEQFKAAGLPLPTDQFDASYFADVAGQNNKVAASRLNLAQSEAGGELADLRAQYAALSERGAAEDAAERESGLVAALNARVDAAERVTDRVAAEREDARQAQRFIDQRNILEARRDGRELSPLDALNAMAGRDVRTPVQRLNDMHLESAFGDDPVGKMRFFKEMEARERDNAWATTSRRRKGRTVSNPERDKVARKIRAARDKEYMKAADAYKSTAYARGKAHALRVAGQTPLQAALRNRLGGLLG